MSRTLLLVAFFFGACGEPETKVVDVFIPVALQDADELMGPCPDDAYAPTRSVVVELHQPIGDLGRCVLNRECVEIDEGALGSRDDLQETLGDHGSFFVELPAYEGVVLHLRGLADAACELPPAALPLYCGFSNPIDLTDENAFFQVAITCRVERSTCPPPPPCAGVELD